MNPPCKDCKKRRVGCHSECEEYLAYFDYRVEYNRCRHESLKTAKYTDTHLKACEVRKANRKKSWRNV